MKRDLEKDENLPKSSVARTSALASNSTSTNVRLMGEWKQAQKRQAGTHNGADPQSGLSFDFVDEEDCTHWTCKKYYPKNDDASEEYKRIREGLGELGVDCVEWHLRFSENYPFTPPRVWLSYPHLESTNVWTRGGVCSQIVSEQTGGGWSPLLNVNTLMVSVTNTTESYKGTRVKQGKYEPHTERGAMLDFGKIENAHKDGWSQSKTKS